MNPMVLPRYHISYHRFLILVIINPNHLNVPPSQKIIKKLSFNISSFKYFKNISAIMDRISNSLTTNILFQDKKNITHDVMHAKKKLVSYYCPSQDMLSGLIFCPSWSVFSCSIQCFMPSHSLVKTWIALCRNFGPHFDTLYFQCRALLAEFLSASFNAL